MPENMVRANGIDICTESFGDAGDAPLLLVMGASAQGIYWEDEFVQRLVAQRRRVIRYDNRDTGRSTCFDFAAAPYDLNDLAADAVGVLDALGIDRADVAGASMGGMIVQALAIHHRARIASATIIMSSPLSGGGEQPELGAADLQGPDPAWLEETMALQMRPLNTREEKIAMRVEMFGRLAGSASGFDRRRQRALAEREFERAEHFEAMNNHALAIGASHPADRRPLLREVDVPALVIHGTEDPILPYPHGLALAETIPGAELLTLDGAGHDLPERYQDDIVAAMMKVSARAA